MVLTTASLMATTKERPMVATTAHSTVNLLGTMKEHLKAN